MQIVKDVAELPKLFNGTLEWGIIITDNQIIVYAQEEGKKWQGHYSGAEILLAQAFLTASKAKTDSIFNNRTVLIGCAPKEVLTVYMPAEHNLSREQLDCLLKYLEDIKQSGVMKGRKILFWDREIIDNNYTLEILLEKLKLKDPKCSAIDASEKIIGISIIEYLMTERKSKPKA